MSHQHSVKIYDQLMDVMERLDAMDEKLNKESQRRKTVEQEYSLLEKRYETLSKKVNEQTATIEEQRKTIDELTEKNTKLENNVSVLTDENKRLKSIINNDSNNSSSPPSKDQIGKKRKSQNEYNSRGKTDRKIGGQPGHKGKTITKEEAKKLIEAGKCKHNIIEIGIPGAEYKNKYIMDIEMVPVITEVRIYPDENGKYHIPEEYKSNVIYGPMIQTIAVDMYCEGIVANDRIARAINSYTNNLFGVATGTIYNFIKYFKKRIQSSVEGIEAALLQKEVVCTDATVVSNNGKPAYIRNFSTEDYVLYEAMESKTLEELSSLEFLAAYTGILVHDHETALYHFGSGHGECNVHVTRYLLKSTEEAANPWAKKMKLFLLGVNNERKERIESNSAFSEEELRCFDAEYDKIIKEGYEENKSTTYKYAKDAELALLNRLVKYKESHLRFMYDFNVPFHNNMSERDLRKCKGRQKMSGGFRTIEGLEMYCDILSFVETCKRQGKHSFETIKSAICGTPVCF